MSDTPIRPAEDTQSNAATVAIGPVPLGYDEPELYLEPTRMTSRDTLGVIVALAALAIIGVSGYVWLNPQLSVRSLFIAKAGSGSATQVAVTKDATAAVAEGEHQSCPYCGMFADKSRTAVAVMWDGGSATFDSFDCVFNYLKDNSVRLESGTVKNYLPSAKPEWIELKQAHYLYDTKEVEGSMSPYVAAFATRALAEKARKDLGGEMVDFAGLENKWN